jgi:hypothetical protein
LVVTQINNANRQSFEVAKIILHDRYKPQLKDFDIAVFQLQGQLIFNQYVQPVCLPQDGVAAGAQCVVTGWGSTRGTS